MGGVSGSCDDVEGVESLEFDEFWNEFGLQLRKVNVSKGCGGGRVDRVRGGKERRRRGRGGRFVSFRFAVSLVRVEEKKNERDVRNLRP